MKSLMPALGLAFFMVSLLLAGCGQSEGLRLAGMQGTASWHVTLTDVPDGLEVATLHAGISTAFANSSQLLAGWDKTSEISRFNQHEGTDWFPVSPRLAQLVNTALQLSEQSGGSYDVTVGPLIKLWGFSAEQVKDQVPAQAEVDAVRAKVGYQKLQARLDPPALRKSRADVSVDLASMADGFATDMAGEYLESVGIHNYMVEIAGEIRTRGLSPRGDPWRIAIEKPLGNERAVQQGIKLQNAALATSGDYRNFFMQGGKRYSHTLDPQTGFPVAHQLASVSVLAENGTLADAYATLLMSLGEVKGKVFAEQHGLAAYFIWREGDGLQTYATEAFARVF